MNFNVSKDNATFFVNPEKRKVICIIDNTELMFLDFIEANLPIKTCCCGWWKERQFEKELEMPGRFVGVATCSQDDEWNEETGKIIAFSRAKDNLNRSFFKRANTYVNTIDDWLSRAVEKINAYGDKVTINTDRRHERIDELLGEA